MAASSDRCATFLDSTTFIQCSAGRLHAADEMSAMRQTEKGRRLPVDGLLNIFMKGCAAENRAEHLMTDFVLRQLDLEPCEDTLVGNDWFRGVSGGQRKRVSAGARCRCAACCGVEGTLSLQHHFATPSCNEKHTQGAQNRLHCLSAHCTCLLQRLPPSCLPHHQDGCRIMAILMRLYWGPGEILVGPKRLYLLDEPTTGLDSSTAHRLVSSIREFVHKDKVERCPASTACPL